MSKKRIYVALAITAVLVLGIIIFFQYGTRTQDVFDGILVWKEIGMDGKYFL